MLALLLGCLMMVGQAACDFTWGGAHYNVQRDTTTDAVVINATCQSFNRLSAIDHDASVTLSNGGLTAQGSGINGHGLIRAVHGVAPNSGKHYWEITWTGQTASSINIAGIVSGDLATDLPVGYNRGNEPGVGWGYSSTAGRIYADGFGDVGGAPAPGNGTIGILYDSDAGAVRFRNAAGWVAERTAEGPLPVMFPAASFYNGSGNVTFNFGASPFVYEPEGTPLCGAALNAIIIAGQSNGGNTSYGDPYEASRPLWQINIDNGRVIRAQDPLKGTTRTHDLGVTSFMQPLAEALGGVILAPIAIGGTYSRQWALGGDLNYRLTKVAKQLEAQGIEVAATLWMHGEGDAAIGVSKEVYQDNVRGVRQTLVNAGVDAPFFVPLETQCNNEPNLLRDNQGEKGATIRMRMAPGLTDEGRA